MPWSRFCFSPFHSGLICSAAFEAETFVSGFEDMTVVSEPVEQRGCHLGITEDGGPFTEAQVRGDDDAGALVELAQKVEEQSSPGSAERQISQLV